MTGELPPSEVLRIWGKLKPDYCKEPVEPMSHLINHIRGEIAAGTYEKPGMLEEAVEAMVDAHAGPPVGATLAARMDEANAEEDAAALVAKLAEPKPGDDCPTQRVIDLQARHAIKEWDGGL